MFLSVGGWGVKSPMFSENTNGMFICLYGILYHSLEHINDKAGSFFHMKYQYQMTMVTRNFALKAGDFNFNLKAGDF